MSRVSVKQYRFDCIFMLQEAGFSFVELNASDTRSKKNLQSVVAESLNNTTMVDFAGKKDTVEGQTFLHSICLNIFHRLSRNEGKTSFL
jgi:replication factor C subunit 1